MRITQNMMSHNYLRSLNSSLEKQSKLQEQLSDGKTIHRPSDNPVKAVRSLRFATSLNKNEQFTQNLSDAQSWMENTDGVMSDMSSIMIKAKELVVSADDTKTASDIHTIGAQIDGLINQIVSLGNTKVGDRYLFAGQSDSTQPFERKTIKDPNSNETKEVIVYNGDQSLISMPIQEGAVNGSRDSVNLAGTSIFGSASTIYGQQTLDVLNHLLEIKNEMTKTSSVQQTNQNGGIGLVGGKYTGAGFKGYDVRVDTINPATGQALGASYSTDGGNTWTKIGVKGSTATIDSTTSANQSVITFDDGVTFTISNSKATITQSNLSGATASLDPGTATNPVTVADGYMVRVKTKDGSGYVNSAEYSADEGHTWTTFSATDITAGASAIVKLPDGSAMTIDSASANIGDSFFKMTNMIDGNYMVKVDSLSGANVNGASYSTDGGKTWTAVNSSNITVGATTAITLPNGAVFDLLNNAGTSVNDTYTVQPGNDLQDVYSFRVPQDAFRVERSNSQGGDASLTGTLTDASKGTASVRIDGVDTNGNVTAASYSTDGGSSWTALSNYKVSQTNTSGPAATVSGSWGGGSHTVAIDSVDADGKVLTVSIDGGAAVAVTDYGIKSDDTNKQYTVANITFGTGQTLTIPTDKLNKQGDTITITQEASPVLAFNATSTDVHLVNGITMNIKGNVANKINDTYGFTLPQGKGPDTKWLSSVATQYISDDHNMQLKAQTTLGARMSMYEMASNMMDNQHTIIEDDLGTNEGLDMAQAITDYNTIQNVYRAALAVGGKIMQTSLVDFLK